MRLIEIETIKNINDKNLNNQNELYSVNLTACSL